jgi:hypothetical protein
MKKALFITLALGGSIITYAQDKPEPLINRDFIFDVVHIIAVLCVIYLISSFILQLIRSNFDFRLKSKLIERQTEENIVNQLVQPDRINPLHSIMQWICILVSVGIGFLLIQFSEPVGLHSLAIMALCVAGGLGLYFWYAKSTKK